MAVVATYACTCGRTYQSPVQLSEPPKCSGGHKRQPKHSTRTMTKKG